MPEPRRIPYMMDIVKELNQCKTEKTITIMKPPACGRTTSILNNSFPDFVSTKGIYNAR